MGLVRGKGACHEPGKCVVGGGKVRGGSDEGKRGMVLSGNRLCGGSGGGSIQHGVGF